MEPKLTKIKNGWAAVGDSWAVFGATQEEALKKFADAEERHKEIARRESTQPDGSQTALVG